MLRPRWSNLGPSLRTSARSTFFFRIRRRSVQMPADGRPPLRLQHSASRSAQDRLDSGYYDVCESPYLYGCDFLQSCRSCPTPAQQKAYTRSRMDLLPEIRDSNSICDLASCTSLPDWIISKFRHDTAGAGSCSVGSGRTRSCGGAASRSRWWCCPSSRTAACWGSFHSSRGPCTSTTAPKLWRRCGLLYLKSAVSPGSPERSAQP